MIRINTLLSRRGLASRREADRLITEGKVLVNGVPAVLGQQVAETDTVSVTGKEAAKEEEVTYMLHKPAGYVTSSKETRDAPRIVLSLIPASPRVFPVGRLDKDTEGLLLLTNDGVLAYRLTHPSFECEKEYLAHLDAPLTAARKEKIEAGMRLAGQRTKPATVLHDARYPYEARIILTEGKNRQVRKVFGKTGAEVTYLKRLRIQGLTLGDLPKGKYRRLTTEEVAALKKLSDA